MATIEHWNKYMNVVHELALVEYDLREEALTLTDSPAADFATRVLYERFGTY